MQHVQGGEEGEGAEEDNPASFQAYTSSHTDNFGDLGIPGRETDEAAGLDGGMGSMTGWRAIAAQVLLLCLSQQGAGAVQVPYCQVPHTWLLPELNIGCGLLKVGLVAGLWIAHDQVLQLSIRWSS